MHIGVVPLAEIHEGIPLLHPGLTVVRCQGKDTDPGLERLFVHAPLEFLLGRIDTGLSSAREVRPRQHDRSAARVGLPHMRDHAPEFDGSVDFFDARFRPRDRFIRLLVFIGPREEGLPRFGIARVVGDGCLQGGAFALRCPGIEAVAEQAFERVLTCGEKRGSEQGERTQCRAKKQGRTMRAHEGARTVVSTRRRATDRFLGVLSSALAPK